MKNELENLSKTELIDRLLLMEKQQQHHQRKLSQSTTQIRVLNQKLVQREEQIALFKRLIFGARRERYVSDASQASLPFEATAEQKKESEARHTQRIEYTRGKAAARKHPGRVSLPDHLPVEQVMIDPPGDLSDKV